MLTGVVTICEHSLVQRVSAIEFHSRINLVAMQVKSMLDSCGYGSDSQQEADQQSMQNSTMRRAASRPYTGRCMYTSLQLHAPCLICALWQPRWPIRTLSV